MKKRILYIVLGIILLPILAIGTFGLIGMYIFVEQAKDSVVENQVVKELLGEITSIEFEIAKSLEANTENEYIFAVSGHKGNGLVAANFITVDDNTEKLISGIFETPDGDTYDIISGTKQR